MLRKFASVILRYRVAFIVSLLALTLLAGYTATFVQLTYDGAKILPNDDPDYVNYLTFKKQFGEDAAVLVIGFKSDKTWQLNTYNAWYHLTAAIKKTDGIQDVLSIARCYRPYRNDSLQIIQLTQFPQQQPTTQQALNEIKDQFLDLRFYEGLLYNQDSNATLMAITFDQQKLNSKSRIDIVAQIVAHARQFEVTSGETIHYSGLPFIRTAVMKKIVEEMKLFSALAILITALILLLFFRSGYAVFYPLIVVIIAVVWSFATMVLFGYKISILTSLISPLLIVIGIPNSILFLNRYQQEYAKHGNKMKALARGIEKIGATTFFANVTTSIGFLVFAFTGSEVLTQFGVTAAVNVMLTWLLCLILIPIVFSYLPAPNARQTSHLEGRKITALLSWVERVVHFHRPKIYLFVLLCVIVSLIGMNRVTSVGYVVDDLPKDDVIYTDLKFFERNFKGVIPLEISIDTRKAGGVLKPQTLQKINALQKKIAKRPEFSKPVSIVELIKFSYQGLNDNNPSRYILPPVDELQRLSTYSGNVKGNKSLFKSLIDSSNAITRVSFQMADVGSLRMKEIMKEIRPQIDSLFPSTDYQVTITGSSLLFLKNNDYLLINLRESVLMAILMIASVMCILFMSLRMSLIAMIPSLIPLMITAAIMGFTGIPLKPSTILIFSIAFGIASDGTMYFLTKYRQELRSHGGSISKTVATTIQETGVSMVYTAVILFCGFFIFTASSFGGTSALGILISVTLLIAMLSNLIFLPTLLRTLERIVISRAFMKEPLIQIYDEEEDVELDHLEIRKEEE
ncbi:MAG: hypothetical protein RIQ89_116 [Bacteroidota bacterium]|jgi:uncharacterized protein